MAEDANQPSEAMRSLARAAVTELTENGAAATVAFLESHEDQELVLEACEALMSHFYWQEKNLTASLMFGEVGVRAGEALAAEEEDPAKISGLLQHVKIILYNAGSFSWTGWNEPGIEITPEQEAAGFAAARRNLELALELERPTIAVSRAWWLLGAHQLTARQYKAAAASFKKAAGLAAQADKQDEQLLSRAFRQLALIQYLPEPGKDEERLYSILDQLSALPEGEFFVNQVETCRLVLGGK